VLEYTGADGIMIGRAAQGRPWIFREIVHYLTTGKLLAPPSMAEQRDILLGHLDTLYSFYGEPQGVRIARKHITWYCQAHAGTSAYRAKLVRVESGREQQAMTRNMFDRLAYGEELAA
jgi:tRNA-dihydrouridine synthase B